MDNNIDFFKFKLGNEQNLFNDMKIGKITKYFCLKIPFSFDRTDELTNKNLESVDIQCILLQILYWVENNVTTKAYLSIPYYFSDAILPTDSKENENHNYNPILYFINEEESEKFNEWFKTFYSKYVKDNKEKRSKLFLNYNDLKQDLYDGEKIKINGTVACDQWYEHNDTKSVDIFFDDDAKYEDTIKLNKEQIEIYFWLRSNCRGKIYNIKNKFYFENSDEAIHFKLIWGNKL